MTDTNDTPLRPVITGTLIVCLTVAIAPWLGGGQAPLAGLITTCALLLAGLLMLSQPQARRLRPGYLMASYAGLIGFAALSLLWTANRYSTFLWLQPWILAGAAFALAYILAGEKGGREWLLRAYLVSAGLFSLWGLYVFLVGDYERFISTIYWANPAAAYLMPAIFLSLDQMRRSRGRTTFVWLGLSLLFTTSFWLADSRGALLVMIISLIGFLLYVGVNRTFWIKLVFILVMTGMLSFGLVSLSKILVHVGNKTLPGSRISSAVTQHDQSGSDRIQFWRSAVDIWQHYPLIGSGAGTYRDLHPQYQRTVTSASLDTHNAYLQTLAELGIVGVLVLMALLVWLLLGSARGMLRDRTLVPVFIGAVAILLHSGIDIDAEYPTLLILVAVLLGLIYRQAGVERGKPGWGLPAMVVLLLVPAISIYQTEAWAKLAQADQADGQYDKAYQRYAEAHSGVVYDPDNLVGEGINLYTLAALGSDQAQSFNALALDRARQAEQLDPHDGQHFQLEGRALAFQSDLKGSEAAYRKALALDPYNHPDYAYGLALIQLRQHDEDGAIKTATAMMDRYPGDAVDKRSVGYAGLRPALGNLAALVGNLYLQRGQLADARTYAAKALKFEPGNLRGRALQHQVDLLSKPAQ